MDRDGWILSDGTYLGRWLDEVAGTPHVSAEVKVLLLTMGRWMDETGHVSIPRPQIASILRCSERRVSSKCESAVRSGFFARTKAGSRGSTAEFQARIPGVQPPERVTPIPSPNRRERVTPTSTLSDSERVTPTSTLSEQRVTPVVTQSAGKGDTHTVTPYIHTYADGSEHGTDAATVGLLNEEKNSASSLRLRKTPARKRAEPAEDPAFDLFWSAYPRRVAKPAARKAWAAAMKRGADPEHIIAAARLYATNPRRKESDPKYTAHPASWLNQERYDDEPDEPWRPAAPQAHSARDEKYLKHQALREELFGPRASGPTLNVIKGELA